MSIPTPPNGTVSNTELILRKILGEDVTPLSPNSRVEFYLLLVKDLIAQLQSAVNLRGETTTPLTDNATTNPIMIDGQSYTAVMNDAVIYQSGEFIFDGTKWHELGDLSNLTSLNINAMTGYAKASTSSAIATTDTLNQAIGKVEKRTEVNENNILLVEEMNGAKNMLQYTLASLKSLNTTNWSWTDNVATFQDGSTFTVNDDMSISANTTSTHTLITFKLTKAYPLSKGNTVLTGCPSDGGIYKYKLSVTDVGYDTGSGIAVDNMTSNKAVSIEVSGNIAANVTFKPMVVTDTVNNAGFTDYQPYAMTNAELTAAEKQNEANILSLQQQVGYANTELEGVL